MALTGFNPPDMEKRRPVTLDPAPVFRPLLQPARYKGAYGGRGSGKSWLFADMLIKRCQEQPGTRWLCVREVQKSLAESAKRLIESRLEVHALGESDGWRVLADKTVTPGGGVIAYQGMQDHTAESIKSYEGFDGAWVEEAQSLSARSLQLLRPTIRKAGSELWFSWNPRRRVDPVDVMLRGPELPTGAVVVEANWRDNPHFPPVLEQERQDALRTDPDQYDHIWEGGYVTVAEGAYYARQLAEAKAQDRITLVGPNTLAQYRVFVDIGGSGARADAFAMWVVQFVGRAVLALDYYEAVGQDPGEHFTWLRERGYKPNRTHISLPHDGDDDRGVYAGNWMGAFREQGYTVAVIPNMGKGAASKRIKAARELFPSIWFNEKTTEAGRAALGWYHEKKDEARGIGLGPEHDWSSHGADAFGLMAVCYEGPTPARPAPTRPGYWSTQ